MKAITVFRFQLVLPLLALALGATGCGSTGDLPTGASPVSGATVQGTVNGAAGAASEGVRALSASGADIRVTVVGTSLSTTTDGSGRFTIQGVPTGNVVLRFQGPGVDATLRIEGLLDGQVLTISVQVNGSQATVVTPPTGQQRVELSGVIQSINAPRFQVGGRSVVTDAATRFNGKGRIQSVADLRVGDRVEVKGTQQSDGSVLAREVKREEGADDDDDGEAELKGRIESISPTSLQVAGKTVRTDASTRIERDDRRIALTDLRVGERVEVKGVRQSDGSILARRIEVEDDDD